MKIAFTDMEEEILPAFKGGEKEYRAKRYGDEACKIMSGRSRGHPSVIISIPKIMK